MAAFLVNATLTRNGKTKSWDEIEVRFLPTPEQTLHQRRLPWKILYEDEHLLAINKPAGMVVHLPRTCYWHLCNALSTIAKIAFQRFAPRHRHRSTKTLLGSSSQL